MNSLLEILIVLLKLSIWFIIVGCPIAYYKNYKAN